MGSARWRRSEVRVSWSWSVIRLHCHRRYDTRHSVFLSLKKVRLRLKHQSLQVRALWGSPSRTRTRVCDRCERIQPRGHKKKQTRYKIHTTKSSCTNGEEPELSRHHTSTKQGSGRFRDVRHSGSLSLFYFLFFK